MRAVKLTFIILGLLVAACSSDKDTAAAGQAAPVAADPGGDNLVFEGDDLTFSGEDELTQADNITFSDGFDDAPAENITFEPLDIPETDFSQAATETEPNDSEEAASALSIVAGDNDGDMQFVAQGALAGDDDDYFSFSVEGEAQLYLIEVLGTGVDRSHCSSPPADCPSARSAKTGQVGRSPAFTWHQATTVC